MRKFSKVNDLNKVISVNAYRGLFIGFLVSGCVMMFLLRSFSLFNSIVNNAELSEIIGQSIALAIIIISPVVISTTTQINKLPTIRIAVGCFVLFLIDVLLAIIFALKYQGLNVNNMVDFYTIVFIFVATLSMLIAKIFTE